MQPTLKTLKYYYTLTQLAQVLKVSYSILAQRVEDGEIPFVKSPITDRKYFDKEAIHQMFNIQN